MSTKKLSFIVNGEMSVFPGKGSCAATSVGHEVRTRVRVRIQGRADELEEKMRIEARFRREGMGP
jgi:hypothetical protein